MCSVLNPRVCAHPHPGSATKYMAHFPFGASGLELKNCVWKARTTLIIRAQQTARPRQARGEWADTLGWGGEEVLGLPWL